MKKTRILFMLLALLISFTLVGCGDNTSYTIEFLDYDGTVLQSESFNSEVDLSDLVVEDAVREGYTFTGWDIELPSTMPGNNLTITAEYDIKINTIQFLDFDETVILEVNEEFGTDLTTVAIDDPTRVGYTFTEWDIELPSTMPANDLTITAEYEIKINTIQFLDFDGTVILEVIEEFGTDLSELVVNDPTRGGHTFTGWDFVVPSTMPANDLTITAVYDIEINTIYFLDFDGSVILEVNEEFGTDLSELVIVDPSRTGYTFTEWDIELPITMPADDLTITAVYAIKINTIEFLDYDGVVIFEVIEEFGTDLSELVIRDPNRSGYSFTGWDIELPVTMPENDLTITAMYTIWDQESFQASVNSYLEELEFNGSILIYKDDETLLNEGYGWANVANERENTPETRFFIGSITKQFTAVAIMMLYEDGLLSVDDTVEMYIPDFPNGDIITIHHLLTHSSGLENYLIHIPLDDEEYLRSYHSPLSLINIIRGYSLDFTPGEEFQYSNTNYIILGYIIEVLSGVTYQEFMQQNIFIPLEMNNTGFGGFEISQGPKDALGYNNIINAESIPAVYKHSSISYSSGSMVSTTGDLLIWHHALMNHILISEATTDLIYTPYAEYYSDLGFDGYGYGWHIMLVPNEEPRVFHSGNALQFLTYFYRNTGSDLAIVFITNEQSGAGLMDLILFYIFDELVTYGI